MNAFYDGPGFQRPDEYHVLDGSIKVTGAQRSPCPVCGHPTGDCAGESGPPKTIFGYNTNSSFDQNLTFLVEEDVIETREIAPGLSTKRVVHKKGSQITFQRAKELGLI